MDIPSATTRLLNFHSFPERFIPKLHIIAVEKGIMVNPSNYLELLPKITILPYKVVAPAALIDR